MCMRVLFNLFKENADFVQALMAPKYWEALKWSEALALNGIGYCKNIFASFRTFQDLS